MNEFAPIALFVYNRPAHTRQCLEALMKNGLAEQSVLYIFSDGPKENTTAEQLDKIKEVRQLLRENKWCKEIHIIEAAANKGIAASVLDGVNDVISRHGKIIVLEDDIITATGFLKYMNDALNLYEGDDKVMHVTGYMFPVKENVPETFFLFDGTCPWGWATWKRAWKKYNDNAEEMHGEIISSDEKSYEFNFRNTVDYLGMLKNDIPKSKDRNWDIRWHATVFLCGGYGLWPGRAMLKNIGHDGSGIHCPPADHYTDESILKEKITVSRIAIEDSPEARNAIIRFYERIKYPSMVKRVKNKISSLKRNIR